MDLRARVLKIAEMLLACPTAPFREDAVRSAIAAFCAERQLDTRIDAVGNVIVTAKGRGGGPVFGFCAHMDHPGFLIEADAPGGEVPARFHGSVRESYFAGAPVRVFSQEGETTGRVVETRFTGERTAQRVLLEVDGPVRRGDLAMWDLCPMAVRDGLLHSRACDDLVGCVSVLALLDEWGRRGLDQTIQGVFTMAEEAGFQGAKHLCLCGALAPATRLIAIETSAETAVAAIGDGVVIRVGDRISVFTPAMSAFLAEVAGDLADRQPGFLYQRALMDGGVCESTIYQAFGFLNGAVCVPLGNYHNQNRETGAIDAEYVSVEDLVNMVELFAAIVQEGDRYDALAGARPPRYTRIEGDLGEIFFRDADGAASPPAAGSTPLSPDPSPDRSGDSR